MPSRLAARARSSVHRTLHGDVSDVVMMCDTQSVRAGSRYDLFGAGNDFVAVGGDVINLRV